MEGSGAGMAWVVDRQIGHWASELFSRLLLSLLFFICFHICACVLAWSGLWASSPMNCISERCLASLAFVNDRLLGLGKESSKSFISGQWEGLRIGMYSIPRRAATRACLHRRSFEQANVLRSALPHTFLLPPCSVHCHQSLVLYRCRDGQPPLLTASI